MPQARSAINVVIADQFGSPYWEAKFRHRGRQAKRRIGPAWVARAGAAEAKPNGKAYKGGQWIQRRGRPIAGALTYDAAVARAATLVAAYAEDQERAAERANAALVELVRPRTFRDVAVAWRASLERKGTKPSTLVGYDAMLAEPGSAFKRGPGAKVGYIMRALGDAPVADVTAGDVEALLTTIANTGASARTVEKHRIMVRSILNFAIRETKRARAGTASLHGHDYGLTVNAAQVAEGPRQTPRGVLVYYLPEDVESIARALHAGDHRHVMAHHQPACASHTTGKCDCLPEYRVGRDRFEDPDKAACFLRDHRDEAQILSDTQDAVAVRVSAYTGLRLGELLALRWSDIDWSGSALTVSKSISARQETTPKSGRVRRIPLPDQAITALEQLSRRTDYTAPDEFVFCNVTTGRALDGSALRRRYKAAQSSAGVHPMRWHDLRHTYGSLLAANGEELVTIKSAMGHANISTTEIYLHARPATELATRFSKAFAPTALPTSAVGPAAQRPAHVIESARSAS